MQPASKRWHVAELISPEANRAMGDYPPILKQIMFNRGISTFEEAQGFLEARPSRSTDPYLMLGMAESVRRIASAIHEHEPIAIYGDYDVDGVTATTLLVGVLKALDANVLGYIPNRFEEGYGLNNEALSSLKERGVGLVITVDCGVRSPLEAQHAADIGLDLIITDHHHPAADLPVAYAIINPKQKDDPYPEKDLAGVGLAYKLASALIDYFKRAGYPPALQVAPEDYLDLVALGTVSDLAPLTGENRSLVRAGLQCIRSTRRQGIYSLINVAGLTPSRISAGDIGFMLGPRLNAAGRIDSALDAFQLLSTDSIEEAGRLAQVLDGRNRERQKIMHEIQALAEEMALASQPEASLLFAADESFNSGVVGLAASRLMETYYRPAIVAQRGEQYTRGSCRSISEFHITDALDECADLLEHHGGHAAAAGFTVRNENLAELVARLQKLAADKLAPLDLHPMLVADVQVAFRDLRPSLYDQLEWLQPTGYGNPQPQFITRGARVMRARQVGADGAHLKLVLDDHTMTFDAIAWRQGKREIPPVIDLIYTFEKNYYNGSVTMQLNVRDFKPAGIEDY